jgi:MFS family permease
LEAGVGIGLTNVQNVAILNEYFKEKRGLANGISMTGGTLGAFVISPILKWSLVNLGLTDSFLVLASISVIPLFLVYLLKSNQIQRPTTVNRPKLSTVLGAHHQALSLGPKQGRPIGNDLAPICIAESLEELSIETQDERPCPGVNVPKSTKSTLCHNLNIVFTNVDFYLIMVSHLACFWGVSTFSMVTADLIKDNQIDASKVTQMITIFSLGDLFGRGGTGQFCSFPLSDVFHALLSRLSCCFWWTQVG